MINFLYPIYMDNSYIPIEQYNQSVMNDGNTENILNWTNIIFICLLVAVLLFIIYSICAYNHNKKIFLQHQIICRFGMCIQVEHMIIVRYMIR